MSARLAAVATRTSFAVLVAVLAIFALASEGGQAADSVAPGAAGAEQRAAVRWEGNAFLRAEGLRRHLGLRGARWETFLRAHPAIVRQFGLDRVVWQDRAFYSKPGVSGVLAARGVSYRRWAKIHPRADAKLRQNRLAVIRTVPRKKERPRPAAPAPAPAVPGTAPSAPAPGAPAPTPSPDATNPLTTATTDGSTQLAASGSTPQPQPSSRSARFGVSLDNPEYRSATESGRELDELAEMGAGWVRFDVKWSDVQWDGPNSFNWAKYDPLVDGARARGLRVLANLAYSPTWARDAGTNDKFAPQTPERREAFARFSAEAVRHFAGRVDHWELWNEPNNPIFWQPQPNAAMYAALINVAYARMKAVAPAVTVLAGATSPGQDGGGWIDEVHFLEGVYSAGGRGSFDAWSHHPYEFVWGPALKHADSAWYQMFGTSPSIRSVMLANGDGAKQIWGTESGPPSHGSSGGFVFTEEHQARQVAATHEAWLSYPWAGVLFTYTGRDFAGYGGSDHWAYLGLLRHDLSRKPAWFSFQSSALAR